MNILCVRPGLLFAALALAGSLLQAAEPESPVRLVVEHPQTMGMSRFRAQWDTPLPLAEDGARNWWGGVKDEPRGAYADWSEAGRKGASGALACDALNRSLLVRFPEAAERIAAALRTGRSIARVEIVLPFLDEELFPPGTPDWPGPESYNYRANWGVKDLYRQSRARWHVVASALRRPWIADPAVGPTLNAAVRGAVHWRKYGAQDEEADRFPAVFGPAEVSSAVPEGRLDVTAALLDPAFGPSLRDRLRTFADCGVIIRKWESYDHRYFRGVYEFATATGGRGILFRTPRLEVTLTAKRGERVDSLRPPADIPALVAAARSPAGPVGRATAVVPSPEEIGRIAAAADRRPAWADEIQWRRVRELVDLQGSADRGQPRWCQFLPPHLLEFTRRALPKDAAGQIDPAAFAAATYGVWIDKLIGRQTRGWDGFEMAADFSEWQLASEILPGPAVDAIRRYWVDWLMPDRETCPRDQLMNPEWMDGSLIHPMADQLAAKKPGSPTSVEAEDSYWLKTGDWRGNKSFFRSGFMFTESTQNFNTTSSIGAAVFGNVIGSPRAIADGRHGVQEWLANHWIWNDGSGQEHLDHYYLGVTLKGLKTLVNGAPDAPTRLLADGLLAKGMEETIAAWHPHLRRFIAPSSRTSLEYLLGSQDGLQYMMHSLSRRGALTDPDRKTLPGNLPVFTTETSASLTARLALPGPWAPPELAALVDEKPLPWEATHSFQRNWRRTWLGEHYGMGSSTAGAGRIQAMAQWRREDREVRSALDLGTLDLRFGANETRWMNDAPGWIGSPGYQVIAQTGHTWLALGVPAVTSAGPAGREGGADLRSLQHSIGFFDLRPDAPTWELWVNGERVQRLPVAARAGQPIVIRDGVTYLGIIALPPPGDPTAGEVRLEAGRPQENLPAANPPLSVTPALVIHSFVERRSEAFLPDTDWLAFARRFTGFAIQLSDAHEQPDFTAFRTAFEKTAVATGYDAASRRARAQFTSAAGTFALEAGLEVDGEGKQMPPQLLSATMDGKPVYPAADVMRETPTCGYGWNAVAKGGAKFEASDAAKPVRVFLETTAAHDRFIAWNPQANPAVLSLSLPSGARISSTAPVGVCRFEADAVGRAIRADRIVPAEGAAVSLLFDGFAAPPEVTLNGKAAKLVESAAPGVAGRRWVVPF